MIDENESNEKTENLIETNENLIENSNEEKPQNELTQEDDNITEAKQENEEDKNETVVETEIDTPKKKKKERHAKEGISNFTTIAVVTVCLIISITVIVLCYLFLTDKIKI